MLEFRQFDLVQCSTPWYLFSKGSGNLLEEAEKRAERTEEPGVVDGYNESVFQT